MQNAGDITSDTPTLARALWGKGGAKNRRPFGEQEAQVKDASNAVTYAKTLIRIYKSSISASQL